MKTLWEQVVELLRERPGLTSGQIREAVSASAAAALPMYLKQGYVRRERCSECGAIWRYYARIEE